MRAQAGADPEISERGAGSQILERGGGSEFDFSVWLSVIFL